MQWVSWYRAMLCGRPVGPWRRERAQVYRDLLALDLGSYEADGAFYVLVPADIQAVLRPCSRKAA
jgi:hypothetical protein